MSVDKVLMRVDECRQSVDECRRVQARADKCR